MTAFFTCACGSPYVDLGASGFGCAPCALKEDLARKMKEDVARETAKDDSLAPFHEALATGNFHEAAGILHALAETAREAVQELQREKHVVPADLRRLIDAAHDAADHARAAAELLHDAIPPS